MTALKGLVLAAAFIVGTSSLAMAQGSSGPDVQLAPIARLTIPQHLELLVVTTQNTISRECTCQRAVRKVRQRRASRTAAIRHRQTFIQGF
jgi:hypothetical protein